MFAVHKTLVKPSSVAHATCARFTSALHDELVVVRGSSCLEVWRLRDDAAGTKTLMLHGQWTLYGVITGVVAVPLPSSSRRRPRDALVLSFEACKAVVVDYDPIEHNLRSLSLHNYEDHPQLAIREHGDGEHHIHPDKLLGTGTTLTSQPPKLALEPSGRFVAMHVQADHLAVIPIRQRDVFLDDQPKIVQGNGLCPAQSIVAPTYLVRLRELSGMTGVSSSGLGESVARIRDVVFVNGYLEPTLAVLYESGEPTWPGTMEQRRDTVRCAFVALSSVSGDTHEPDAASLERPTPAALFTSVALPSSTFRIVPVPTPLGGVLLLAAEGAIYLSQATAPNGVGVMTNAYALGCSTSPSAIRSTLYPFSKDQSILGLHLDGAVAAFLEDPKSVLRCMVSLRTGRLWACDLIRDAAGRSIDCFRFSKVASSSPASCMVSLASHPGQIFLGSGSGPSLVLSMVPPEANGSVGQLEATEPSSKRRKVEANGTEGHQTTHLASQGDIAHDMMVVDDLPNLGNLKDGILCHANGRNMLFSLSGHDGCSQYVLFQQSLHSAIKKKYKIHGAKRIWSVRGSTDVSTPHSHIIVSGDQKTSIYKAGIEFHKPDSSGSGFQTSSRTLHVGEIQGGSEIYLLQVLDYEIVLLDRNGGLLDRQQVVAVPDAISKCEPPISVGDNIASASCGGHHVVLVTQARVALIYAVQDGRLVLRESINGVAHASLYFDKMGVFASGSQVRAFQQALAEEQRAKSKTAEISGLPIPTTINRDLDFANGDDLDDLDLDLYYDASARKPTVTATAHAQEESGEEVFAKKIPLYPEFEATDILLIAHAGTSGHIAMMRVADLKIVFAARGVHEHPMGIANDPESISNHDIYAEGDASRSARTSVAQIYVHVVGPRVEDAHLHVVTRDSSLSVYQAHHLDTLDDDQVSSERSAILWSKMPLDPFLMAYAPSGGRAGAMVPMQVGPSGAPPPPWLALSFFHNISGNAGVFAVRGGGPGGAHAPRQCFWIMTSRRGKTQVFPMEPVKKDKEEVVDPTTAPQGAPVVDRELHITGFAELNTRDCSQGFVLTSSSRYALISQLESQLQFDEGLPYRTYKAKRNAHMASYDEESHTIALATSKLVPFKLIIEVPDQQEHHPPNGMRVPHLTPEMLERDLRPGTSPPGMREFTVDLISTDHGFERSDRYLLEQYEHVVCIHHAKLDSKQARTGKRNYLVVGTAYVKGEDVATRGRIHVLETIRVVPEPGKPQTCWKLKVQCIEEIKAPVTALTSVQGHLVVSMGAKVLVYDYEEADDGDRSLMGIAFHDAQIFVSHLAVLKNFIIVGDMYKSVQLLVMQEDPPKLLLLGKDHHPMPVTGLEMAVHGPLAGFIAADDHRALHVLMYAPHNMLSFGGTKLLRRADFFLGSVVSKLVRFRMLTEGGGVTAAAESAGNTVMGASAGATVPGLPARPISLPSKPGTQGAHAGTTGGPSGVMRPAPRGTDVSQLAIANWFVSRDGTVGVIAPVSEVVYKRLLLLYNRLSDRLPTCASLHPKAHRHYLVHSRLFSNNQAALLDLDLVMDMLARPLPEQLDHARAMGSALARIRGDVRTLHLAWTVI